jgi:RNA polymerase sigma factor (sigma-70 family)
MAMKEDNRQDAEKAFSEFYNRYKNYLYTVARKACKSWEKYGEDLVQSVHENTFLKVFERAESFLFIDDFPIERQEKRLKSWLGSIAHREMFLLLRQFKEEKEKIEYHNDLSFLEDSEEDIIPEKSETFLLAEKALNSLSERDRNILVTYLLFQVDNKNLPSNEIERLAEMWGVLPDNLRQIKKRSLAKVKEYIETYKRKQP